MDNGRYGKFAKRIVEICMSCGINVKTIPVNLKTLQDTLIASPDEYCGVVVVHCETSSGIVNPVDEIGEAVKKFSPGERCFGAGIANLFKVVGQIYGRRPKKGKTWVADVIILTRGLNPSSAEI